MSTQIPTYSNNNAIPQTLEAFKNRSCSLPFNQGYTPATPDEICSLIEIMGWSQNQVAMLTGVNFNPSKGSPTVRRWKTKAGEHRQIPYSAWRLMLITAGVVEPYHNQNAIENPSSVANK